MSEILADKVCIDDFKKIKLLGSGGMGDVYLATQVKLDRPVALKILGPRMTHVNQIGMQRREGTAVARLKHPSIPAVYYIGQDEKAYFIAYELIPGSTLSAILERLAGTHDPKATIDACIVDGEEEPDNTLLMRFDQEIPDEIAEIEDAKLVDAVTDPTPEALAIIASAGHIRRCCELAANIARTLAYAHEQGVIHRDIKPSNLMIDRSGKAYVIDFGVARYHGDLSFSAIMGQVGTPQYMSPEGVTGRLNVDHRSDIFSLGLVLYEALTLSHPFPTSSGVMPSISQPLPPIRRRNPAIPEALESVVHRATAREPKDRYQSALDFAEDLERFLGQESVVATPYVPVFNPKEIAADRPLQSTISANILFFYVGVFLLAITGFLLNPILDGDLRNFRYYTTAGTILIALVYYMLARGVLHARRGAIIATILVSGLAVVYFLFLFMLGIATKTLNPFSAELFILIVLSSLYIIRSLCSRESRSWARRASELRADYRRAVSLPGKAPVKP